MSRDQTLFACVDIHLDCNQGSKTEPFSGILMEPGRYVDIPVRAGLIIKPQWSVKIPAFFLKKIDYPLFFFSLFR